MNLDPVDATVLFAYLAAMVAFGVFVGRGSKSSADFMVGGRDLPWYAVLFSIVATETSTVTFLSVPGIAWKGDLTFLQLPLGYIVGRLLVVSLLLPRYFRGDLVTAYEVLDQRFGGAVKRTASVLFLITRTLGDGLRLFLGAIVLEQVADIDLAYAVLGLGLATVLYTVVGGIRAVVWTDFIQFVVYMAGAGIAFWILMDRIPGGFSNVVETAGAEGKLRVFDFGFDLSVSFQFWVGLIGGAVFAVGTHGVDQLMVQRYLCARSQRQAALALGLSGPVVLLQFAFFLVIGTALFVFYREAGRVFDEDQSDRVFATFIVEQMPVGVLGIVLGALFSAAMSTLSSSLNSSATVVVNDLLAPRSDGARLRLVKVLTLGFGLLQIGVGLAGPYLSQAVIKAVLAIQSFTVGIILGVFFLALATERLRARSALIGLTIGILAMTGIKFGTTLAWPWFALVGSTITFVSGILAHTLDRNAESTA